VSGTSIILHLDLRLFVSHESSGQWLPRKAGGVPKYVEEAIDTILNFLNYVVMHEVCPEYADDLARAQQLCRKARTELPRITELSTHIPSAFDIACRTAFCGGTRPSSDFDNVVTEALDPTYMKSVVIVQHLIWFGQERTRALLGHDPGRLVRIAEVALEVVAMPDDAYPKNKLIKGMVLPTEEQKGAYARIRLKLADGSNRVHPCGMVRMRPTVVEDGWDRGTAGPPAWIGETEDFLVSLAAIQMLEPGLKLRMVVCELGSTGLKFVKKLLHVYPTFYQFLPQDLMTRFKHPMLNERDGPSVDDPEIDLDGGAEGGEDDD
jgi:hypothetical protein